MSNWDDMQWEEIRGEEERKMMINREEMMRQELMREEANKSEWWSASGGGDEIPQHRYDSNKGKSGGGFGSIFKSFPVLWAFIAVGIGMFLYFIALVLMGALK